MDFSRDLLILLTCINMCCFYIQIVVAGLGLPWLGYAFGYLLAVIFKRKHADCLTIAIETGIQNTGISIYLLRFTLLQPEADLTTGINNIFVNLYRQME